MLFRLENRKIEAEMGKDNGLDSGRLNLIQTRKLFNLTSKRHRLRQIVFEESWNKKIRHSTKDI